MSAVKDITKIIKDIRGAIADMGAKKQLLPMGKEAVRLISIRTRLGYGVRREGAKRQKLKSLAPSYIEYRKKNRAKLSEFTRFRKSNLTFTGQMIDRLDVKRSTGLKVTLGWRLDSRYDTSLRNSEVAELVSKRRPWLNLTDLELKKLTRFYSLNFGKLLKRKKLLT